MYMNCLFCPPDTKLSIYLVAVGSFANFVPEIAELIGNQPKYGESYVVGQNLTANDN